jgi:hypothetical protein
MISGCGNVTSLRRHQKILDEWAAKEQEELKRELLSG